jgi:hypothetical protein
LDQKEKKMNPPTNNNISRPIVYKMESVYYRQSLHAENTGKDYYALAHVVDHPNTLSVTEVGGRGGGLFFCVIHNFVHHPTETCDGCRNAVVDLPCEASVTSCDTP